MEIRTYQPGDVEKIVAFNDEVLKEFGFAFSLILDRDVFDIPKYYTRRGGEYFLMVDDSDGGSGKIVGSIAVSKITRKICKLRHFYLAKEYRRKGHGKKLYSHALEFIRETGYDEIWLSTAAKFMDAIGFYERNGFTRAKKPLWDYTRAGVFYTLKLHSKLD